VNRRAGGAWQLEEVTLTPHRPGPPLETFTVRPAKADISLDRKQRHILLHPGDSATARIRQPQRFANNRDEPVTFTVPAAYGEANAGGAAKEGLPANPLARLGFVKTSQGQPPGIRLFCNHSSSPLR
jgi:hypothetical protein